MSISEARWVSARLYEDVERGIYKVQLNAQKSPHSIELTPEIIFYGAGIVVGTTVLQSTVKHLVDDLYTFLKGKWNRKKKRDSRKRATAKRATKSKTKDKSKNN